MMESSSRVRFLYRRFCSSPMPAQCHAEAVALVDRPCHRRRSVQGVPRNRASLDSIRRFDTGFSVFHFSVFLCFLFTEIRRARGQRSGRSQACALVLGTDTCPLKNSLKYWGSNSFGQFGEVVGETRTIHDTVKRLDNGSIAVVAGLVRTCVCTSRGGTRCWCDN